MKRETYIVGDLVWYYSCPCCPVRAVVSGVSSYSKNYFTITITDIKYLDLLKRNDCEDYNKKETWESDIFGLDEVKYLIERMLTEIDLIESHVNFFKQVIIRGFNENIL